MKKKNSNPKKRKSLVFHAKPTGIITPGSYCKVCDKTYLTSRSLEQHIQRGHL